MEEYRDLIRHNIQYPLLVAQNPDDADLIDESVELMTETVCARRRTTRVCGSDFLAEMAKSRMLKLDGEHIKRRRLLSRSKSPKKSATTTTVY